MWSDGFIDLISNWSAFVSRLGDIADDVFQLDLGAQVSSMEERVKPLLDSVRSSGSETKDWSTYLLEISKNLLLYDIFETKPNQIVQVLMFSLFLPARC